jgi:hypothetical protein
MKLMQIDRRGRGRRAPSFVAIGLLLVAAGSLRTAADEQPPPGTVSKLSPFPNFASGIDKEMAAANNANWASQYTFLKVDDQNQLAFEHTSNNEAAGCKGNELVKLDLSTGRRLAAACPVFDFTPMYPYGQALGSPSSYSDVTVVFPKQRAILYPQLAASASGALGGEVVALSEDTLSVVGSLCVGPSASAIGAGVLACSAPNVDTSTGSRVPLPPYNYIHGLSRSGDDLVVLTDNGMERTYPSIPPLGVAASLYHLDSSADGHVSFTLRWTVHIPSSECSQSLRISDTWSVTAAYLSRPSDGPPSLFVPCAVGNVSTDGNGIPRIIKVPLDPTCTCPLSDPPARMLGVTAPAPAAGFLFDPDGQRGYLIPSAVTPPVFGATVLVYDGHGAGSIVGRFAIDSDPITTGSYYLFGVDPDTGRFYAEDAGHGLRVVDGRRTPLNPGAFFPWIVSPIGTVGAVRVLQVAHPDPTHPYTRVFLGLATSFEKPGQHMDSFTILADRLPVTQDPPPAVVDNNTYPGQPPAGSDVSSSYSTHGSGYGIHSDLVGGYAGAYYNTIGYFQPVPYGGQTVDVAMGSVESAALRDGVGQASSSAMFDLNGFGSQLYRSCTDRNAPANCLPPQCDVTKVHPPQDPCPAIYEAALANDPLVKPHQSTAQEWPYPTAECSHPGPKAKDERRGIYQTETHSTEPDAPHPSMTPIPYTDTGVGAKAATDCADQVIAMGQYSCGATGAPAGGGSPALPGDACNAGGQSLTVSSAQTTTTVIAPDRNGGKARTEVTASVAGLHLTLPDGSQLSIGEISQFAMAEAGGRAGTAHTLRTVSIQDVRVSRPDGSVSTACVGVGSCMGENGSQAALLLGLLNGLLPARLYVTIPAANEPFGVESDGISPKGSPGGYQAVLEADAAQQQGDRQFNAMTGFRGSESKLLPALRIVQYSPGAAQVSREVLDFAGVEADAQLGYQVTEATTGGNNPVTVDQTQSMIEAGVPPSTSFVPGDAASSGLPGQQQVAQKYPPGLLGLAERALTGLGWLVRSPLAGAQMAAFLVLLGGPLLLMRRRWITHSR